MSYSSAYFAKLDYNLPTDTLVTLYYDVLQGLKMMNDNDLFSLEIYLSDQGVL